MVMISMGSDTWVNRYNNVRNRAELDGDITEDMSNELKMDKFKTKFDKDA